jgi:uncharacterized protein (DUF1697 family)
VGEKAEMTTIKKYCAFLRGVNVNGRKMPMQGVCSVFQNAGMSEVSSLLATGNILFQSDRPQSELREILQSAMAAYYKSPVYLFVKSAEEIGNILKSCPFEQQEGLHCYVFVCESGFETKLIAEFQKITPLPLEKAALNNGEFYWQVPKGSTLDAGFSKTLARSDWQSAFTSRNLKTIAKLDGKIRA